MTEVPKTKRPIAVIILAILTFLTFSPLMADYFMRDPLEVSFRYPGPGSPTLDADTYFAIVTIISFSQVVLFLVSIITGVAILRKQGWSWFTGVALHAIMISLYVVAIVFLPPYTSNERIAFIVISVSALYLLARNDVRAYLRPSQR